jgi:preprotein translocase subunit YajC
MKLRYWIVGIIVVGLIAGSFYWFQWRPSKARQDCNSSALETQSYNTVTIVGVRTVKKGFDYNSVYIQCLREKGL